MTTPTVKTISSSGPIGHYGPEGPDELSTPCPACRREIQDGEPIAKHAGQWLHGACLTGWMSALDDRQAWLVLGGQLARRPSAYGVGETRAIVTQLVRIAGGLPPAPWQGRSDP